MTLAIIDYGSGNLRSAARALERVVAETGSAHGIEVTADPDRVGAAERIVLPGVGAFADCKRGLEAIDGMVEALEHQVLTRARPFLGICVGMQLTAETGHEHGATAGFGWIPGRVVAIEPGTDAQGRALKVPHMGWNSLAPARSRHPVLDGLDDDDHLYFVHSFHLEPACERDLLATTDYGGPVTAAVGRETIVGTQFHPEKSQSAGLRILANFLRWRP